MRCLFTLAGLMVWTALLSGCGSDVAEVPDEPAVVAAPSNIDAEAGADSEDMSNGESPDDPLEDGADQGEPKKDPVARPSVLMEFMAQTLRDSLEPGAVDEEAEVEEKPADEAPAEETPEEEKPADEAPAEETPEEE